MQPVETANPEAEGIQLQDKELDMAVASPDTVLADPVGDKQESIILSVTLEDSLIAALGSRNLSPPVF